MNLYRYLILRSKRPRPTDSVVVVRSTAFHEAQKICVINNLTGVSIFEIDADLHMMAAVANFAIKRSCHNAVPLLPFWDELSCTEARSAASANGLGACRWRLPAQGRSETGCCCEKPEPPIQISGKSRTHGWFAELLSLLSNP